MSYTNKAKIRNVHFAKFFLSAGDNQNRVGCSGDHRQRLTSKMIAKSTSKKEIVMEFGAYKGIIRPKTGKSRKQFLGELK